MAEKKRAASSSQSGNAAAELDLLEKGKLGRYEIKKKLGSGGMGTVFLALDTDLNRLLALKVLPQDKAENPTLVKRFKAEAQAVAQLTHDHIVRIYESGDVDGYKYIALEYVEGTDVQRLIKKRGRLPVRRATEIIKQVAEALEHASLAGIVHRDIKPSNLLITQSGVVKLTDLGLARALDDEETSITRDGTTVGTVDYMSPEQGRSSKAADIRSDLYSLGCTWYHMLTGSPPFPEGNITNKLHAHSTATIPDPRSINESVPEVIVSVINRMMSKKPIDRYQSARELLDDLAAVKKNSRREISAADLADLASPEVIEDEQVSKTAGNEAVNLPMRSKESRVVDDVEEEVSSTKSSRKSRKSSQEDSATEQSGSKSQRSGSKSKKSGSKSTFKDSGVEDLPPRERKKLADVESNQGREFNWTPFVYAGVGVVSIAFVGLLFYVFSGVGDAMDNDSSEKIGLAELAEERQKEREAEADQQNVAGANAKNTANARNTNSKQNPTATGDHALPPSPAQPGKAEVQAGPQVIRIVALDKKTDATSAHSLQEAIDKATDPEIVIELSKKGLSIWDRPIVVTGKNLTVRVGKEGSGQILIPSASTLAKGFLTVRKGTLKLQGLHFGLLGYELSNDDKLTLIRTVDAELNVRDCSFTIEETRQSPVVLCDASWSRQRVGKSRWKHCLIRGSSWKPFVYSGRKFEAELQGSLLAIGNQPVYTVNHVPRSAAASKSADAANAKPDQADRNLSINDCVIVCQGNAITINNASGEVNVPTTVMNLNRSNIVASTSVGAQPFLLVQNWPENVLKTAGNGKLTNIDCRNEETVISGWSHRLLAVTSNTNSKFEPNDDASWEEFWGNADSNGRWDLTGINLKAQLQMAYLKPSVITSLARAGEEVAKETATISAPALLHKSWRSDYAFRLPPRVPTKKDLFAEDDKDVKKVSVDLNQTDLSEFLASQSFPGKTIVEARGFGLRSCLPITIVNKQVKILFITEKGKAQLTLRPVSRSVKSTPWITVKNGTLEIEAGVFSLASSKNAPMPSHWIKAENSAIHLTKCHATGPGEKHPKLISLIQMTQPQSPIQKGNGLTIDRCYFQYGGDVIDANLHANPMLVQNSLLVSKNHLFKLYYPILKKQQQGLFEVSHCTLSSENGLFHFDLPASVEHTKPPVEGIVTDCVFVSPILVNPKSPAVATLLSSTGEPADLAKRLWWWGSRNGFAPKVSGGLAQGELSVVWPEYWGPGHVDAPLFGADGVMLEARKVTAENLSPAAFNLYSKCKAASWGKQEQAIGVDVKLLEITGGASGNSPGTNKPKQVVKPAF
ncbi:MAG: serine/threonine protein kinase [Planctomycetaceae bacterium]|nr:serine/threonine protein kinase [Planctomycetaceae bacterium]